jgi:hypothetical protein
MSPCHARVILRPGSPCLCGSIAGALAPARASERRTLMQKYRMISLLTYGAAALGGALLMAVAGFNAILAVGLPFALAAVADRFVNRNAEPDERLRSFVIYLLGAVAGLVMVLVLGGQLGGWTWISPVAGFIVFAIIDYLKPPEEYTPNNKHRYGNESPPVTVR